jgi:flagellar hook-associated protein 1
MISDARRCRLGGANGPLLVGVDGGAGSVSFSRNDGGAFAFAVNRTGDASAVTIAGGTLAGIADSAQRIADARVTLGGIASDFADAVNAFQADGRDLDGSAGPDVFSYDTADPSKLTVTLTDPRKIAAAGVGGGPRDNANLLALADKRATAGYEGRVTSLIGGNATALSSARAVAAAQTAIREGAVSRYDATAGVDLDQEAVDLMRYQQAYQAAARVIQVGRECFQSLINSV